METREEGAIRTIPDLTILIRRRDFFRALSALTLNGWHLLGDRADDNTLDWSSNRAFTKGDETLHLHWRLSETSSGDAIGFERAFLEGLRTIVWRGKTLQVPSREADLLHRLTGRPDWDPVPWQADVLMMQLDGMNWTRFRKLATRYASFLGPADALSRLLAMQQKWQLPIPEMAPKPALFDRLRSRLSNRGGLRWKS